MLAFWPSCISISTISFLIRWAHRFSNEPASIVSTRFDVAVGGDGARHVGACTALGGGADEDRAFATPPRFHRAAGTGVQRRERDRLGESFRHKRNTCNLRHRDDNRTESYSAGRVPRSMARGFRRYASHGRELFLYREALT